jgi:hypothetical protein
MQYDVKAFTTIVNDQIVDGIKSHQISVVNDSADIEGNADGTHTFVEHSLEGEFESTISIDPTKSGNNLFYLAWKSKALVVFAMKNLRGSTTLFCLRARVMPTGFGYEKDGITPCEWKVKGVAEEMIPGGNTELAIDAPKIFPPLPKI